MISIEKENWLDLVLSPNQEKQKLALELAPSIKEEIQEELILWLELNDNFFIKSRIFELLTKDSVQKWRKRVSFEIRGFHKSESYTMLQYTDNAYLKQCIVNLAIFEANKKGEVIQKTLFLIGEYKNVANVGLKESSETVQEFLAYYKNEKENH